jgi:hypothetical protein
VERYDLKAIPLTTDDINTSVVGFQNKNPAFGANIVGNLNNIVSTAYSSTAVGSFNLVLATASLAVGTNATTGGYSSVSLGSNAQTAGGYSCAGPFSSAGGLLSTAFGGGRVGLFTGGNYTTDLGQVISAVVGTANPFTLTVPDTTLLQTGVQVNIGAFSTVGPWDSGGTVGTVLSPTQITLNVATSGFIPAVGNTIYTMTDGYAATAFGRASRIRNRGAIGFGATAQIRSIPGDAQSEMIFLGGRTLLTATPLLLDCTMGTAISRTAVPGLSSQFVLPVGQAYEMIARIIAVDADSASMTTWQRRFLAYNFGGVISISPLPEITAANVIGTDIGMGVAPYTTTWVTLATTPFAITANNTTQSVDITVTGDATKNTSWLAYLTTVEAR